MEIIVFGLCMLCFLGILLSYCRLYTAFGGKVICNCRENLKGKTVLITGGSRGIGLETATTLASLGARVLIASSNPVRGKSAVEIIKSKTNNPNVTYYELHLDDFMSVRSTAENIINNETELHILINNAAIAYHEVAKTNSGCERVFGTNYLGHFLLTYLLVSLLRKSTPSRIVNVTSITHRLASSALNFTLQDDSFGSDLFPFLRDYDTSKLALVILTKELTRRLSGFGITCNSVHPGFVVTSKLWMDMDRFYPFGVGKIMRLSARPLNQGVHWASQSVIHTAISPQLNGISGKYIERCKIHESVSTKQKLDDLSIGAKLWSASMLLTGCTLNGGVIQKLSVVNENENKWDQMSVYDGLKGARKPSKEPEFEAIDRGLLDSVKT